MRRFWSKPRLLGALGAAAALIAVPLALAFNPDTNVTHTSPVTPFSQNKQNEPALAVDANHTNVLVAGANEEIDMEACNAGDDTTCPFTPGVGVSGVYFSFNSGDTWIQPTYSGLTGRGCTGVVGNSDPDCTATTGPIGTLPKYSANGLVSDGDPAVAFGPRRNASGNFDWGVGSRLYYANLTSNVPGSPAFKGFEAIAVSRTDNLAAAAANSAAAWRDPVIISKQSSTTFTDKEQIWADNASNSSFFGNVYVCWADFRSAERGRALPTPLIVAVSSDGGDNWTTHQISGASDNPQFGAFDGCTVRTDSDGTVYVFTVGSDRSTKQHFEFMSRSFNGGSTWTRPQIVAGPVTLPGEFDAVLGRPVLDGVAGARDDLAWGPSVDIANGAPTGGDATDRIVMTYVSGTTSAPHVYFTESTNHGKDWSAPRTIEESGDRGYYTAPSISPNGRDVYVVYNAFTTPFRTNTTDTRNLVGVVRHADSSIAPGTATGAFTTLHRSLGGDPRGSSQNNLVGEFLGDYVYAVATRTYGAAVWNEAHNTTNCPAMDAWRMALRTGDTSVPRPAPQQDCLPNFGNSDIFGGSYAAPTP